MPMSPLLSLCLTHDRLCCALVAATVSCLFIICSIVLCLTSIGSADLLNVIAIDGRGEQGCAGYVYAQPKLISSTQGPPPPPQAPKCQDTCAMSWILSTEHGEEF